MQAKDDLMDALRARIPGIHLRTLEEDRALEALRSMVRTLNQGKNPRVFKRWSAASGLWKLDPADTENPVDVVEEKDMAFDEAMTYFKESTGNLVLVLFDPWDELARPLYQRHMREALFKARGSGNALIIVGKDWIIPQELQADIYVCDLKLPTFKAILEYIEALVVLFNENMDGSIEVDKISVPLLAKACLGLTLQETKSIVSLALIRFKAIGPDAIKLAISEKKQIVTRTGLLEYEEPDRSMSDVGGLVNLKNWIGKRAALFSEEARKAGIKPPKGILLIGPPGTGKTLCARAVAAAWSQPLVRMDVGKLFGSLVGQSESNLRTALQTAEAVSPCVMLLDEIEKAFGVGGSNDGGTSQRVLGSMLSWMQDHKSETFIVATANDIDKLDPAMVRRFDAVFAVDLPGHEARAEILGIHLAKSGNVFSSKERLALAEKCLGFTGSELETAVQAGLIEAFNNGDKISYADLVVSIKGIKPISLTMKDSIEKLRNVCKSGRAIPAADSIEKDEAERLKRGPGLDV